jgi:hypothetical protein
MHTGTSTRTYRIEPLRDPVPRASSAAGERNGRAADQVAQGSAEGALAPDYFRAVVGWRTWLVVATATGLRLRSVVFGTNWPVREELPARCELALRRPWARPWHRVPSHEAPSHDCDCGIWAAKDLEYATSFFHLYDDLLGYRSVHRVVGRVRLWGSVAEGGLGWRASYAYPASIYVPTHREDGRRVDAKRIASGLADYGVAVEIVGKVVGERVGRALAEIRRRQLNRIGELS